MLIVKARFSEKSDLVNLKPLSFIGALVFPRYEKRNYESQASYKIVIADTISANELINGIDQLFEHKLLKEA